MICRHCSEALFMYQRSVAGLFHSRWENPWSILEWCGESVEKVFRIQNSPQNVETSLWNLKSNFLTVFHQTFATNWLTCCLLNGRDKFVINDVAFLLYMLSVVFISKINLQHNSSCYNAFVHGSLVQGILLPFIDILYINNTHTQPFYGLLRFCLGLPR